MGLDMYLEKEHFVGWHDTKKMIDINDKTNGKLDINVDKVTKIVEEVCYWRKANAIHAWFVENVQDGKDECQRSWVAYDQLMELRDLCLEALANKDKCDEILPTQSGFFFGSCDYDDWYWDDIQKTADALGELDKDGTYYYQASW